MILENVKKNGKYNKIFPQEILLRKIVYILKKEVYDGGFLAYSEPHIDWIKNKKRALYNLSLGRILPRFMGI